MKKTMFMLLSFLLVISMTSACGKKSGNGNSSSSSLTIGGSTSVQPLMEKLAEAYNKKNKGNITVQGGGSSVGITGAIDNTFDVAMSSRSLDDSESSKLDATSICLDGIAVIVNKENPVSDLTLDQLKKIYTGKITNWKEVGGDDKEIQVISREEGSGTRDGFQSIVGFDSDNLIENSEIQNATGSVVSNIIGNENAIGYISLGAITSDIKTLKIEGVNASIETIADGTYKLQRNFILAVKKNISVANKLYDFIWSDEGKKIISDMKYVPLKK